jgi:hypothetical protein
MGDPSMSPTPGSGPQLTAEIAEKVMGWKPYSKRRAYTPGATWTHPDGYNASYGSWPNYSTDIAAAFLVVEKMRDRGRHWRAVQSCIAGERYRVGFTATGCSGGWHGVPEHEAVADALPLAICLAALKAIAADAQSPRTEEQT